MNRDLVYKHAKHRPMRRVQPDWWVRSFADNGDECWNRVKFLMETERVGSTRKITRLFVAAQDNPKETIQVANYSDTEVLCLTAAEAKRAGLEVAA